MSRAQQPASGLAIDGQPASGLVTYIALYGLGNDESWGARAPGRLRG